MHSFKSLTRTFLLASAVGGFLALGGASGAFAEQPNPCAPKGANPCALKAGNPCAPKAGNPCAPKAGNPCASRPEVDPKLVVRPAGTTLAKGDHAALVREGEKLFKDTGLSTNGMACESCHADNGAFMPSFAEPYPHTVAMAQEKGGVKKAHLDEMVQFCMVVPMAAKPLPWDSRELAALTAYTGELQKKFQASAAKVSNPCAPKANNPCAPR